MNSKKCLVLGAAGFLGFHLCEALAKAHHQIRAFSRHSQIDAHYSKEVEWCIGDFNDFDDLYQAVDGCEVIFHLISSTTPASSNRDPLQDLQTNVGGALKLLEMARSCGVQKIVFASSGGTVYGIPQQVPLQETMPTFPICSYGIGKLAIEKYLHMYYILHGMDYCILRVANLFGERQCLTKGQGAVGVFMDKAIRDESVEIWGDGEVIRDYVYVKDVADALIKAAQHTSEQRIFNIGSGIGRSLNEVLLSLESVMGCSIERLYRPRRPVDVPANVLDISLAKQDLQWIPQTEWRAALSQTYQWMLEAQRAQNYLDKIHRG